MVNITKDFRNFANSCGVPTSVCDDFTKYINNSLTPVVLEERKLQATAVDVFSRLLYDRQIFFGSNFTPEACNVVIAELMYLASLNSSDISIMINSQGGSVIDGLAIIDTINWIKSKHHCDVATICIGMAASMGAVLLTSGAKDKRYILPHSRVMIHQVSSFTSGSLKDMEIEISESQRCRDDIYKILTETTGKSMDEIVAACDRNNWMHGQEVIDFGLADHILT